MHHPVMHGHSQTQTSLPCALHGCSRPSRPAFQNLPAWQESESHLLTAIVSVMSSYPPSPLGNEAPGSPHGAAEAPSSRPSLQCDACTLPSVLQRCKPVCLQKEHHATLLTPRHTHISRYMSCHIRLAQLQPVVVEAQPSSRRFRSCSHTASSAVAKWPRRGRRHCPGSTPPRRIFILFFTRHTL